MIVFKEIVINNKKRILFKSDNKIYIKYKKEFILYSKYKKIMKGGVKRSIEEEDIIAIDLETLYNSYINSNTDINKHILVQNFFDNHNDEEIKIALKIINSMSFGKGKISVYSKIYKLLSGFNKNLRDFHGKTFKLYKPQKTIQKKPITQISNKSSSNLQNLPSKVNFMTNFQKIYFTEPWGKNL